MPVLFALAFWVLPTYRQVQSFTEQTAEFVLASTGKLAFKPAQGELSPGNVQRVLQKFPVWHSEQIWLQGLVDLAKGFGVSTEGLKHTGMRRKEAAFVAKATRTAFADSEMNGHLEQRGYEWQIKGSQEGVSRVLESLAVHALWVDELVIWPDVFAPGPNRTNKQQDGSASGAGQIPVSAMLTFRQSARVYPETHSARPVSFPTRLFTRQSVDGTLLLPSMAALFAPANGGCLDPSAGNSGMAEHTRVFADQGIDHIRLAGVIEKTVRGGNVVRRAVFRSGSGALVVATPDAEISAARLRLEELNKSRAVLFSDEGAAVVLMLEPLLVSGTRDRRISVATTTHE